MLPIFSALGLAWLVALAPQVARADMCSALGANIATCTTVAGCAYFNLPAKKSGLIGCQSLDACTPFWKNSQCQLQSGWCIWTTAGKCVRSGTYTYAPSAFPTVSTAQPSSAPLVGCPASTTSATCTSDPRCGWFAGTACVNAKKCKPYSYGCQAAGFCGMATLQQCLKYQSCAWTGVQCVPAPPTASPTAPTTIASSCDAITNSSLCTGGGCAWFTVKDCSAQKTNCRWVSLGCHANATFCAYTYAAGLKYPSTACNARSPRCTWDKTAGCLLVQPTIRPTAFPTQAPATPAPTPPPSDRPSGAPTQRPSTSPITSPSFAPTQQPSHAPSAQPSTSPSSSKPTRSPTASPSRQPSRSPTFTPCTVATTQAQCISLAGPSAARCEWVTSTQCDTNGLNCMTAQYGCQDPGYCLMTKGKYLSKQCTSRASTDNCVLKNLVCVNGCPGRPAPLPTKAPPMCSLLQLGMPNPGNFSRYMPSARLANAGWSVAGAGADVNGDGVMDLLVGMPGAGPKEDDTRPGTGQAVLVLSPVATTNTNQFTTLPNTTKAGFVVFNGTLLEGLFGNRVVFCDLDNDGLSDIVSSPDLSVGAGQVYIVWGRRDLAQAAAQGMYRNLESADPNYAVRIPGLLRDSSFGSDLAQAGDFDGDGFPDLVVGARDATPDLVRGRAGEAYVIYGGPRAAFSNWSWTGDAASGRFSRIMGRFGQDAMGTAVAGGVDVDGDGLSDVVLGAPWASNGAVPGAGEVYVVFGVRRRFPTLDLLHDPASAAGRAVFLRITGKPITWGNLGFAVGAVGDFNADGFDDIALGAPMVASGSGNGEAYVVFGGRSLPGVLSVAGLAGGSGFRFVGETLNERCGSAVSKDRVDFNGDGYMDLVVSAPLKNRNGAKVGDTYVYFGRCDDAAIPSPVSVANLNGYQGLIITGRTMGEESGISLASAGVDRSTMRSRLILGAPYHNANAFGAAYVVAGC